MNTNEKKEDAAIDPAEFSVAETESETNGGSGYEHHFKKPFPYKGKTISTLYFDWDALTGKDSLAIEQELATLGKALIAPEFSGEYLTRMAVRACQTTIDGQRLGVDFFYEMPMRDFNRIRSRARSFLVNSAL